MQAENFDEKVGQMVARDARYTKEAYKFVREVLAHAQKKLAPKKKIQAKTIVPPQPRHVSGQELLESMRQYTLKEFGPMGKHVLAEWGILRCEDVGEIVFNMVAADILSKRKQDVPEDFAGGFDFEEALARPFLPPSKLRQKSQARSDAGKETRQ